MTSDDPGQPSEPTADREYARPDGVEDSFAPRTPEPLYSPPPPTVSPEERAEFGRPSGQDEPFAPLPGERIAPAHRVAVPPVPAGMSREFSRPAGAEGFDPEPGTRLYPSGRPPESPWWKADARRDPWRDPRSPFWLGRPAVFAGGRPAQLAPEQDSEQDDELPVAEEEKPDEPVKAVRGGRFGLSALLIAVVVALVAGALGGGAGYLIADRAHGALHNGDIKLAKTSTPANRPKGSIADIAQRLTPAVVFIKGHVNGSGEATIGSGVVIHKDGYILTNNHVVADYANSGRITVTFSDKSQSVAQIVGRDPQTDLAVLKVDKPKLTVATLGDSDKLAVGDPVVAIGAPLGLTWTVTQGIISALHRPFTEDANVVLDAIQTDTSVNQGNSGGALIDASGAVIGINSAGVSQSVLQGGPNGSVGLNFAIPIDQARPIAETLIHGGKVVHASIGMVTISTLTTDSAHDGAYVKQVVPEGPAEQAGLRTGDVITVADSTIIDTFERLAVVVMQHKPGDKIKVRYYRGSKESDVTITLAADTN